jgi:hypothetical protein
MVAAATLTVLLSMLQLSHAQTNADFQNTILTIHNRERAAVNVPVPIPPLTWNNNLADAARIWATHLATLGLRCDPPRVPAPSHLTIRTFGAFRARTLVALGPRVPLRRPNESRDGSTKSKIMTAARSRSGNVVTR